ncbi:hypothetical protein LTR84_004842 [Exophiala bonariae]|uniref:Amidase domain-containing protein n=1 Tax=Exophiala bonariae TaxID=1690606 RepID=A0AAV9NNH6_9EURO|nr:hypothetical protein LTR84_004842 [Exophiala bonariae]
MLKLLSRGLLVFTSLITIQLLVSLSQGLISSPSDKAGGETIVEDQSVDRVRMIQEYLSSDSSLDRIDVLTATAHELQDLLTNGSVSSVDLVHIYLRQIESHNHKGLKLNAVISVAPIDLLIENAKALDRERAAGNVRSPLHGIPILVKDNIVTDSALGMDTTSGSFAFRGVKTKKNSPVVDRLVKAGLIIIGKANLSEWAGHKGYCLTTGWSAVGGQTQSPYVEGGVRAGDKFIGHSTPCGSSSGNAVGLAAGFSPLSLGTETDGSVLQPAGRASVYALKATVGVIPTDGTSPSGPFSDSLGPMAKDPEDLASLMGILMETNFSTSLTDSWKGQRVAFVNPDDWELGAFVCNRDEDLLVKQRSELRAQIDKIEKDGAKVVRDVNVAKTFDLEFEGKCGLEAIWDYEFPGALAKFFDFYQDSSIKTLQDLIQFNNDHPDLELPKGKIVVSIITALHANLFPNLDQANPQGLLTDALEPGYSKDQYEKAKAYIRGEGKATFDSIFLEQGVDVVAGPLDGRIVSTAACAGYPACVVPLGYAPNTYGRAYGVTAVAAAGGEGKLIEFMSAWAASNPGLWQPPPLVVNWDPKKSSVL